MKTLLIAALLSLLSLPALADVPGADPCQNPNVAKSSVSISVAAAGTTQLVALSGTTTIYVCGYAVTNTGATTATTAQFEYGTGAACATGPVVLTGTFGQSLSTTAVAVVAHGGFTIFKTIAANALCIVVAGTTPSVQGVLTYVQI